MAVKPVCYLDLDGVLVDFVAGGLAFHGKTLPPDEVRWDFPQQVGFVGTWAAEFWNPLGKDFWAGLGWTVEGKLLLAHLEVLFGDRVVLLSSPCGTPGRHEGKCEWVERELPAYRRRVCLGAAKHLFAAPTKILVDDHDANADAFTAEGGRAVLVPRPWNRRRGDCRPGGLFDVQALIDEIEEVLCAL